MANNTATGHAVGDLNSCLRGEISAVETYRMALDKIDSTALSVSQIVHHQSLSTMMEQHGRAAQRLRERIRQLGGEASDASGAWGAWAKTVQGAANLLGDTAALKSLKEGEAHGLKLYEHALERDYFDASSRALLSELMGDQRRHVQVLDSMIQGI